MLTSTLELVRYYVNLLIIQYLTKPKASATIAAQVTPVLMPQTSIQLVDFGSAAPASGVFVLSWDEVSSAAINWNDSQAQVQTKLRAITGLSTVVVVGSPADKSFTVTFVGVTPPADLLVLVSETLNTPAPTITETDETLPFAIQNAFNLNAPVAVGAQLDTLGQYTGVTRTGQGFISPITLSDTDFLTLIRLSIFTNSAQSDLGTIQSLIQTFFPDDMRVYDYQNMHMSYVISTGIGSRDLVEMFVTQGLLPRPMGVQVAAIVFTPTLTGFFGMVSYEIPVNPEISPFNTYEDYQMDFPWLDYSTALPIT